MGLFDKLSSIVGKGKGGVKLDKATLGSKIRQADLFRDLPDESLDKMLSLMESVQFRSGDSIVRQGDEGDYYYLLVTGTADVTRTHSPGGAPENVATLEGPKGFGEEALISNAKRNATVTMTSAGAGLRLSKDAFNDYVKTPLLTWFSPLEAQQKISQGARWVDVRDTDEARQSKLHGAIGIPMHELRDRSSELDKTTLHVCYCSNGRLSSTAAFLLRQRGYNVGVLRGGLRSLQRAGIA